MQFKNKIYFIMLGLVAQLFFFGYVAAEPLEAGDNLSGQEISLRALALEEHHLTLVAFSQLVVEAKSWERWLPIMIQPPKGLSITGSSTTVQAIFWESVGLIDSGSEGWLSIAGLKTKTNSKGSLFFFQRVIQDDAGFLFWNVLTEKIHSTMRSLIGKVTGDD